MRRCRTGQPAGLARRHQAWRSRLHPGWKVAGSCGGRTSIAPSKLQRHLSRCLRVSITRVSGSRDQSPTLLRRERRWFLPLRGWISGRAQWGGRFQALILSFKRGNTCRFTPAEFGLQDRPGGIKRRLIEEKATAKPVSGPQRRFPFQTFLGQQQGGLSGPAGAPASAAIRAPLRSSPGSKAHERIRTPPPTRGFRRIAHTVVGGWVLPRLHGPAAANRARSSRHNRGAVVSRVSP